MGKLAVVAIGGNSLTRSGQRGTIAEQFENARATSRSIADMIARGYDVVVTHGNGPQVGNILLRAEMASSVLPMLPLDTCGSDSQGGIGYMLQQVLANELVERGDDLFAESHADMVSQDAAGANPTEGAPAKSQ